MSLQSCKWSPPEHHLPHTNTRYRIFRTWFNWTLFCSQVTLVGHQKKILNSVQTMRAQVSINMSDGFLVWFDFCYFLGRGEGMFWSRDTFLVISWTFQLKDDWHLLQLMRQWIVHFTPLLSSSPRPCSSTSSGSLLCLLKMGWNIVPFGWQTILVWFGNHWLPLSLDIIWLIIMLKLFSASIKSTLLHTSWG